MAKTVNCYHYLPVDDAAMAWGVYLTSVGRQAIPPGERYPVDVHPDLYRFSWERGRVLPELQAVLITEGQGVFESEATGSIAIPQDSVFLLFPGVRHRYRPLKKAGWVQRWIGLNGTYLHHVLRQNVVRPESPLLTVNEAVSIAKAYDSLLERVHANPTQNTISLSFHAMGLWATIFDAATGGPSCGNAQPRSSVPEPSDFVVSTAIEFIWTRSHLAITVPQIAKLLGVMRRTLERRFRSARGHSVLDEIVACRMQRAQRLLCETDLPIKAITQLSGFTSEQRLRSVFLEKTGLSPLQFRKKTAEAPAP
jgi:AraC-like DNA-binding protein